MQETLIKFCPQASDYAAGRGPVRGWEFAMARPAAMPFLPAKDFQAPPQYDSVDEALTPLTVGQALGKLPLIYSDVMHLVWDGDDYAF
jgi:hypothetical protein